VIETLARALARSGLSTDAAAGNRSVETRTIVRETVEKIIVRSGAIEITLKRKVADQAAAEEGEDAAQTVLKASLPAPRPRARKQIILPGGSRSPPRPVDRALILALARARAWMRALRDGDDTAAIAQRSGLSDPHVRRLLRFACLAPDIVEAIVEGRQPRTLTVKRLLQGIPLAWSDQRAAFGFGG
jgi:hypothetical protein